MRWENTKLVKEIILTFFSNFFITKLLFFHLAFFSSPNSEFKKQDEINPWMTKTRTTKKGRRSRWREEGGGTTDGALLLQAALLLLLGAVDIGNNASVLKKVVEVRKLIRKWIFNCWDFKKVCSKVLIKFFIGVLDFEDRIPQSFHHYL